MKNILSGFPILPWQKKTACWRWAGDLRPERLLLAYTHGIFPWYQDGDPILWWCPHTRFVLFPDRVHVSRSMKKFMRRHDLQLRINRDFGDTMHRCRMKREEEGTWITDKMETAYGTLHRLGLAISAEAFVDGTLSGGLYGVKIGRCFFGESMFSDAPNGSKAALILFARHLAAEGCLMIDCQFPTEHLTSMGGVPISFEQYDALLQEGCAPFRKQPGHP